MCFFKIMCRSSGQMPGIFTCADIFFIHSEGALRHHGKAPVMLNLRTLRGIYQLLKPTALATKRDAHMTSQKGLWNIPSPSNLSGAGECQSPDRSGVTLARSCIDLHNLLDRWLPHVQFSLFGMTDLTINSARSFRSCWPGEGRTKI